MRGFEIGDRKSSKAIEPYFAGVELESGSVRLLPESAIVDSAPNAPWELGDVRTALNANITPPGKYRLIVTDLVVKRKRDQTRALIPMFTTPAPIVITDDDLGLKQLSVKVNGVLCRITLLRSDLSPVSAGKLSYFVGSMTVSSECDHSGSVMFFGETTSIRFLLDPWMGVLFIQV